MPSGFAQVFGGSTLYPAMANYQSLVMSASVTLTWPTEQQIAGQSVASSIIDVNASTIGLSITLPSAQLVSPGYVVLFNNLGANAVTVLNNLGATLLSLPSGQVWTLYLADNSTPQGTWRIYQQGAGTSVANAASLAGAGLQAIGAFLNQVMAVNEQVANYTVQTGDRADVIVWLGGTGTLTLPAPATVGTGWFSAVKNLGTGTLTLSPASGQIDLAATKTLNVQDSLFVGCDGAQYFTIGFGRAVASTFGFVSINVAGTGTFVLSGAQLNQVSYRFTGALTGTRTIQVPSSVQQYWIDNETTGAFSLFIATSTQTPGISVGQGQQAILFCDGTNVVTANSSTVTFPISAPNGGTGQSTVVLGDLLYGSAANAWSRLPGSASASRVFLSQTGTGIASAAPLWTGLQPTDLGSGPASVSTFLRGNQVWSTLATTDLGVGLANNTSVLRGDLTWSSNIFGPFSFTAAPAGAVSTLFVTGPPSTDANGFHAVDIQASLSTGLSLGLRVRGGTNATDHSFVAQNAAGTISMFEVFGDTSYGFFRAFATPSLSGSAAGNVAVSPPSSGSALTVSGAANAFAGIIIGNSTVSQSLGLQVRSGTNSADYTVNLLNQAGTISYLSIFGDSSWAFGRALLTPTLQGTSAGNIIVNAPSSGFGLQVAASASFSGVSTTASAANAFLDNSNSNNLLRSTSSIRYKQDVRSIDELHAAQIIGKLRAVSYRSKAAADDPTRTHYGLIAEEVAAVDPSLVSFDAQGRPDGVQYERVAMMLLPVIQKLLGLWPTSPH